MSRVPYAPSLVNATLVKTGLAVSTPVWRPLSRQSNWIIGRGAALAPAWSPTTIIPDGSTYNYSVQVIPRLQALKRLYVVKVSATLGTFTGVITINGQAIEHTNNQSFRTAAAFEYTETVAAPSTAETTITVAVKSSATTSGSAIVWSIAVYELPRAALTDTSASGDHGCDPELTRARQPMQDSDAGSIGGVARAINQGATIAKRCGLFSWAAADADAVVFNAGAYTALYAQPLTILARKLNYTTTTSLTQWRVRAKATTAATKGTVRLTATSGASTTIAIDGAVGTTFLLWPALPTVATLAVDAEDTSTTDGRVGGAWDAITVEVIRTAGAGNIEVAGLFGAEAV